MIDDVVDEHRRVEPPAQFTLWVSCVDLIADFIAVDESTLLRGITTEVPGGKLCACPIARRTVGPVEVLKHQTDRAVRQLVKHRRERFALRMKRAVNPRGIP